VTQSGNEPVLFRRNWVLAGVAVVSLWRIAALVSPSSLLLISEILRLPVCLLGILFLVCGVWAWCLRGAIPGDRCSDVAAVCGDRLTLGHGTNAANLARKSNGGWPPRLKIT
jgi:hypothetical protein